MRIVGDGGERARRGRVRWPVPPPGEGTGWGPSKGRASLSARLVCWSWCAFGLGLVVARGWVGLDRERAWGVLVERSVAVFQWALASLGLLVLTCLLVSAVGIAQALRGKGIGAWSQRMVVGSVGVAVLGVLFVASLLVLPVREHAVRDVLVRDLREHREELERVVRVWRADPDGFWRSDEGRRLRDELPWPMWPEGDAGLLFVLEDHSFLSQGTTYGIEWRPGPADTRPSPAFEPDGTRGPSPGRVHVEGPWYVYWRDG